jgi:transcriptional regulator with XRE-family HTH domain/uncharacterized ParB-like nuclease family protein
VTAISISSVVIDMSVYPRAEWSDATVNRYAEATEAGEKLPPIVLETGTHRLLDGMHRYRAHKQLGRTEIDAEHHDVPDGEPVKLYAASLSARHGDRISGKEMQGVARQIVAEHPEFSMQIIARRLGVTRQSVGKWCSDITERRRIVRKVKALLLTRAGWSARAVAEYLGVGTATAFEDVKSDISEHITEDLLREALIGLPEECEQAAEEIREDRIFASWSPDERDLLKQLRGGETVVLSMRGEHANLIEWADGADLYVRIDRRSEWGNPFELPADGDRETVIRNYAEHYLPHKPSLLSRMDELRGKALGCWCAPDACHGDALKVRAEQ